MYNRVSQHSYLIVTSDNTMPNNMYTTQELTDMVEAFILEDKNAHRATEVYRRRYPDRLEPHSTIMYRLYTGFQE